MNNKEELKLAIEDLKKQIERVEKNMDKLTEEKTNKAIKEFDDFYISLRKFWLF